MPVDGGLTVLLTNITLASRTGTEINVRDIARELSRRGHRPVVFSPDLGEIAEEIRAASLPVVDDLGSLGAAPDVVHGHHHPETMAALLRFPGVPALFFAHDYRAWHDLPPRHPRIRRYVAVDETNLDRLVLEEGIPAERTRLVLNAVDLERFRSRGPLPELPKRALVYSRTMTEAGALGEIRRACAEIGLPLDVAGGGAGPVVSQPEELLPRYDLVFAKARCALEALAVGAAVVVCDEAGLAGLVTEADLPLLRSRNFGRRALRLPVRAESLIAEVRRYDHREAAAVTRRVREEAALPAMVDRLLSLYREAIDEEKAAPASAADESRALARYLEDWGPRFEESAFWQERAEFPRRRESLAAHRRAAVAEHGRLLAERPSLEEERERWRRRSEELESENASLRDSREQLEEERVRARDEAEAREREWTARAETLASALSIAQAERERSRAALADAIEERDAARREIQALTSTTTWKLRERLVRAARRLRAERAVAGVLRRVT